MTIQSLRNRSRSPEASQVACFQEFASVAAAEANAALIDGHTYSSSPILLFVAAEANAALIDGHQLGASMAVSAVQPRKPTRP